MVPRVSVRLWPVFVRDPFSWSCAKHFVNAVARPVPSLSFLLTKLLHPSPSTVKLPEPSQYKSLGDLAPPTFPAPHPHLPLRTPDTLSFLFLRHFLFCPTPGPLHVFCLEPASPSEFFLSSGPRSNAASSRKLSSNSEEGMDPVSCRQSTVPQKCIVGHVPRPSCPRDSRSAQHAINTGEKGWGGGGGSQVVPLPRLQVFNHPPAAFNVFF